MVRKSNDSKIKLIQEIAIAVQAFQEATDSFDYVAARSMGLNQTDLKCLSIIFRKGPVSASEVAKGSGLTRGAATVALDRIEAAGLARRARDPSDRRGVLLEATPKALSTAEGIWGFYRTEGPRYLSRFSASELRAIRKFLVDGAAMQLEHAQRIRRKMGDAE